MALASHASAKSFVRKRKATQASALGLLVPMAMLNKDNVDNQVDHQGEGIKGRSFSGGVDLRRTNDIPAETYRPDSPVTSLTNEMDRLRTSSPAPRGLGARRSLCPNFEAAASSASASVSPRHTLNENDFIEENGRSHSPNQRLTRSYSNYESLVLEESSTPPKPSLSPLTAWSVKETIRKSSSSQNVVASRRSQDRSERQLSRSESGSPQREPWTYDTTLPTLRSSHSDLSCISSETLVQLISGEYSNLIQEFFVVDCRYDYEFNGGHIRNAINISDQEAMVEYFMSDDKRPDPSLASSRKIAIIFHCEFSSQRGPSMFVELLFHILFLMGNNAGRRQKYTTSIWYRRLRQEDRLFNGLNYPKLCYPELYLLQGGYKAFYEAEKAHCEPCAYVEMVDKRFKKELTIRAAKSSKSKEQRQRAWGKRSMSFSGSLPRTLIASDSILSSRANTAPANMHAMDSLSESQEDPMDEDYDSSPPFTSPIKFSPPPRYDSPPPNAFSFKITAPGASSSAPPTPLALMRKYKSEASIFEN